MQLLISHIDQIVVFTYYYYQYLMNTYNSSDNTQDVNKTCKKRHESDILIKDINFILTYSFILKYKGRRVQLVVLLLPLNYAKMALLFPFRFSDMCMLCTY